MFYQIIELKKQDLFTFLWTLTFLKFLPENCDQLKLVVLMYENLMQVVLILVVFPLRVGLVFLLKSLFKNNLYM